MKEALIEETWKGKNEFKANTIRKIIQSGGEILYSIDSWHETPLLANLREIDLIASIGRRCKGEGSLTNITLGGEGALDLPEESRKKLSASLKQRFIDRPELREEMSARLKQLYIDRPELRAENSARMNQLYIDRPELKEQISDKLISYYEEHPELIDKLMESKETWKIEKPEEYAEAERKKKEITGSPECREQISSSLKAFYEENPDVLLEMSRRGVSQFSDPSEIDRARQNAIKNNSANSLIRWMRENPELHAEKLKNHSQEMVEWHANNRERTKEIAAKRNAKLRTDEHRRHMAKKTEQFVKNNPVAVKARLDAVAETNDKKAIVWQECLQIIGAKALSEGKLRIVPEVVTNKTLYKWKQKGIVPENMPNGFSSIEILEKFKSDLQS